MQFILSLSSALLFAVWHSFADSIAWRVWFAWYSRERKKIPNKMAFLFSARSACEHCNTPVRWFGLIPIIGYFLERGKCHHCTRPISWRFPLFETLAASYGFVLAYAGGITPTQFVFALLTYGLVWIVMSTDYRTLFIPTEAIFGLLLLALANLLLVRYPHWFLFNSVDFGLDLAVSFLWYFIFHLLRILSGYKMGLADVRLVLALGMFLGHPYAIYLPGFAAFFAIGFYFLRRNSILIYAPSQKEIPFGVFLGVAFLVLSLLRGGV